LKPDEAPGDPDGDEDDAHGPAALPGIARRDFLIGAAAVAGGTMAGISRSDAQGVRPPMAQVAFALTVNGQRRELALDPRVTLLDALREHLQLTGTKKGCDHGQCGACTVLVNGRRINSCLSLAVAHEGDHITTIEGLGRGDDLHPVQAAFLTHDGFQCGYCTPGQICSAVALLDELRAGTASAATPGIRLLRAAEFTDAEIRERMSGNLCRCGAYPNIVAAIRAAGGGASG
jgi:xanthine dehydrogenase YagT iron-sulfur-binding subunit